MKPRRPVIQFYISPPVNLIRLMEFALQTHSVKHVIIVLLTQDGTAVPGKINVIRVHLFILASLLPLIHLLWMCRGAARLSRCPSATGVTRHSSVCN